MSTDPLQTNIRDADPEDLPAIVEIYNQAIPGRRAVADTMPVTVESRIDWFEEHDPASRPIWVLEHQGSVIAWLSPSYSR